MSAQVRRYAALLRGVSPMNASMPELQRCLEGIGLKNVRTVLASGNVVFDAPVQDEAALEKRLEEAMARDLAHGFPAIVRSVDALWELLHTDPYEAFELPAGAKRVVTFLRREPATVPELPLQRDDATILCHWRTEVYSAYVPGPKGPVFMTLLERTFGKDVTTRTWDTVIKVASS